MFFPLFFVWTCTKGPISISTSVKVYTYSQLNPKTSHNISVSKTYSVKKVKYKAWLNDKGTHFIQIRLHMLGRSIFKN